MSDQPVVLAVAADAGKGVDATLTMDGHDSPGEHLAPVVGQPWHIGPGGDLLPTTDLFAAGRAALGHGRRRPHRRVSRTALDHRSRCGQRS